MPNRKKKKPNLSNTLINPIHQSVAYYFNDTNEVIQYQNNKYSLGRYGRYDNSSWLEVEQQLAALDDLEEALIFPSGMSAITSVFLTFLKSGDKIIYAKECYRNTKKLCETILAELNIEAIPISIKNTDKFNETFDYYYDENVKLIFIESPSNPHLYMVDFERIKQKLNKNTLFVVDSTFATPINFKPKYWGADLVIHSCTKYLSGHADILAGSVSGSYYNISKVRDFRNMTGCIISSQSASLLSRSLATLKLRVDYLNTAGLNIAQFLENNPLVNKVFHTSLPSHPHYLLANKYLTGHGSVISFEMNLTKEMVSQFIDALKIPYMGSNFGSYYSMVEQCSLFTYYNLSTEEREAIGISDNLVRLSLGFEDINAIIDDIKGAFSLVEHYKI